MRKRVSKVLKQPRPLKTCLSMQLERLKKASVVLKGVKEFFKEQEQRKKQATEARNLIDSIEY